MIRKIILENYMAHVHTVIEPAAGLTVLVGPNNCGKSAIIHALEMICYNSDAADFAIRHGARKATVTVETEDEDGTTHKLVWWRTKTTAGYIIDGREISGMGKGKTPDDLHRYLRMPEIDSASGKGFLIHFGLQKQPIFLLDEPPSRAAQFFASSSDADRLMEMQRRHKQNEANAKRDKERLDVEVSRLDLQLGDLSPLTEISDRIAEAESAYARLMSNEDKPKAMARFIDSLDHATASEHIFLARADSLANLQSLPDFQPLDALKLQIGSMTTTALQATMSQAKADGLTGLQSAPDLIPTSELIRLVGELAKVQHRCDIEADRARATQPLLDVPKVEDPAPLGQRIALMQSTAVKVAGLVAWHRILETIPPLPQETDSKPLQLCADQIAKSATKANDLRLVFQKAEQKQNELREQIEQWVKLNPRCQSCGQEITPELIFSGKAGEHAHQ